MPARADLDDLLFWPRSLGPTVSLADGTPFPAFVEYQIIRTVQGAPFATLRLEVVDGHPLVISFGVIATTDGDGVTAADWRWVRFDAFVDRAVRQAAMATTATTHAYSGIDDMNVALAGAAGAAADQVNNRRWAVTDDLLRRVAHVVREDTTGRRNVAVQKAFHTSARNATRWIRAAIDRGFLKEDY
jgi:hypothetical protein